jgi:hypothetical protein
MAISWSPTLIIIVFCSTNRADNFLKIEQLAASSGRHRVNLALSPMSSKTQGNFYVSEYGENDRIQKFSPDRKCLLQWGSHGEELGQFLRPQSLALDEHDHLWVADACNHRIQVFDATGDEPKLLAHWGVEGTAPGELRYPYGILLADDHVYVTEFGNHRVQQFTRQGQFVRSWGAPGHAPGQLQQPWSLVRDREGTFFVLDTYNHRIQRFRW